MYPDEFYNMKPADYYLKFISFVFYVSLKVEYSGTEIISCFLSGL